MHICVCVWGMDVEIFQKFKYLGLYNYLMDNKMDWSKHLLATHRNGEVSERDYFSHT